MLFRSPTPDPITNHPNNQRHQPRHDRRLGPVGPPDRVESEREEEIESEEESERDELGEEKSESDEPRDRISEGGERGGESQRLGEHEGAKVEQGDGAERNREFDRETEGGLRGEDWGFEGEERESESEREEKRKNEGRGERKRI